MLCPFCNRDNDRVVDSRVVQSGRVVRRRRECLACSRRFTTYEQVEEAKLRVVKKDGSRVNFDRQKVIDGLVKACYKRPVPIEDIERIVLETENQIAEAYEREVPSHVIGLMIMNRLKDLDAVAYVRFASVYREFKDVSDFMDELRMMVRASEADSEAPLRREGRLLGEDDVRNTGLFGRAKGE